MTKEREIKKKLKFKFDEWLNSISDEELRKQIKKRSFITGGSISSLLMGQEVNDYDIFFTDKAIVKDVLNYYLKGYTRAAEDNTFVGVFDKSPNVSGFNNLASTDVALYTRGDYKLSGDNAFSQEDARNYDDVAPSMYLNDTQEGVEFKIENDFLPELGGSERFDAYKVYPKKNKSYYTPIVFTRNALTLTDQVQLIIKRVGSPDFIHESFDYAHCTNWWSPKDNSLHLKQDALQSILTKELKINNAAFAPVAALFRLPKMLGKGFTVENKEILELVIEVNKLDFNDKEVVLNSLRGLYNLNIHKLSKELDDIASSEELFEKVFEMIAKE